MPRPPGAGRKKGTPNKVTRDVREAAGKYSKRALLTLVKLLDDPDARVKATAAREILDRAHGKPMTPTELTGKDGAPLHPEPPQSEMSNFDRARKLLFLLALAAKDADPSRPLPKTLAGFKERLEGESEAPAAGETSRKRRTAIEIVKNAPPGATAEEAIEHYRTNVVPLRKANPDVA